MDDAPRWFTALQTREGFGARALEFLTLTATRSQEARGARWDEIDIDKALWVIPAPRMKGKKEHRIPLSERAMMLLTQTTPTHGHELARVLASVKTQEGGRSPDHMGTKSEVLPRRVQIYFVGYAGGQAARQR